MADRTFRITISGHGGEFAFSQSSLEEFTYWDDVQASIVTGSEDDTDIDPLMEYILYNEHEDEGSARFDHVEFPREGVWFEQDDIEHSFGALFDYAYLTVEEVSDPDWDAEMVNSIYDDFPLSEAVDYAGVVTENVRANYEGYSHVLACVSIEKGTFFESYVTTNGEDFDIQKLKLRIKEYITEDEIVEYVYYDGEQLDGETVDIIGKSMYVQIYAV